MPTTFQPTVLVLAAVVLAAAPPLHALDQEPARSAPSAGSPSPGFPWGGGLSPDPPEDPRDGVRAPAREARIDSLFSEWDRPGSPGVAVAVSRDGRIVFQKGYGEAQLEYGIPVTPETVFHVASVSKQFTAFGIALLEADDLLSVDDDIRTHLPELPDLGAPVTIRQLVHHTSGIRDQWELLAAAGWRLDDVITKEHILGLMLRQRELNFPPGSEYLYSNMGYTLLAEIVERVGGRPFPDFLRERVFEPLGMASTHMHTDHEHLVPGRAYSYRPVPGGEDEEEGREQGEAEAGGGARAPARWRKAVLSYANAGATSLFTTAPDLLRWLGNYDSGEVGGPGVVERMRERGVLGSGDTIPYAFAMARGEHRGRTTWAHGGADAGFRSYVIHVPEERLAVAVLGNAATFRSSPAGRAVLDVLLDEVEGATPGEGPEGHAEPARDPGDDEGPPREPPRLSSRELAAYEGTYYSPELETLYRIVATGDGLLARHPRHGDLPLAPTAADTFEGERWFFSRLVFERDEAGHVTGFRVTGSRVRNLWYGRLAPGALPR